jgi:superfamily II RNA helicase
MSVNIKTKDCEVLNKDPPIIFPYELDTFQKNAINSIEEGNHVLVTAHTSAGKTTIAQYAISKALADGKKVVYTSPIKTLSNQKYFDFKQEYESVGILTGDIKQNPEADCIVMTTEILRNMLFRGNEFISELEYVIFDEVHYINDRDRGHVWEETIVMLPKHIKIIMLSATIQNSKSFAEWIALIKNHNVDLISTPFRPIPLKHYIYHNNNKHLILNENNKFNPIIYQKIYSEYIKKFKLRKSYKNGFNKFIIFLKQKNLFPCIFFCFSRKKCEEYARSATNKLTTYEEESEINNIINKYMTGIFKDYDKLEQTQTLRKVLANGYGFHHSGLVHPLKEIQEILFSKGLIKILFATETFAVGVNMPTRTVIFTDLSKYDGYINGMRDLNTSEYIQMAGRSGRRGKDKHGTVIYYPIRDILQRHEIMRMMTGSTATIKSKLKLNTQFLLKILQSSEQQIGNFVSKSLLGVEDSKSNNSLEVKYKDCLEKIKKKEEVMKLYDNNNDEITRYFELFNKVGTVRGNKIKKIERELSIMREDYKLMKVITMHKEYNKLVEETRKLDECIKSNTLHLELEVTKKYLMDIEFIRETDKTLIELDKSDLTKKGIIGSEINECNEILLTGIIESEMLNKLSIEEICAVLAIFIETNDDNICSVGDLKISDNAKDVLYKISEYNIHLDKIAIKHNLDYNPYITLNFVMPMYQWASGMELREIYQLNSLELYEGNFVKSVTKILNICNEIIHVCEITGKTVLVEKLQNIESLLLRDVVSFDSIYVNNESF